MGRQGLMALLWGLLAVTLLPATARAADLPADRCAAIAKADFSATRDAPFLVTAAVVAGAGTPGAYCAATGYVAPEISFEMRLPLAGWNRGIVLVGSGGWATAKFTFLCDQALRRGYACIAGDSGHRYPGGLWMRANAQTKIDWGYRATHVKALAAKVLAQAFYGDPVRSALMLGCSTGGYQGLVEAQRFPWDFSGIVAVAPDIDQGDLNMRTVWAARHYLGDDGKPLFAPADLLTLHRAALAACDMGDGVRDGIIGNPMACRLDPATTICRDGRTASCLSARQATAAAAIYAGPSDSAGRRLSTAGPFPGSELNWPDFLEDVAFSDGLFRYALADAPADGVSAATFDFDADPKRLGLLGTMVSSNPDLRRFQAAGGKLMIVQGANDATEQAHAEIDYYQTVERVSGGAQATRAFARLFLVPGMNHCSGGEGASAIDYLGAMQAWVDQGRAPDVLIGSHVADDGAGDRAIRDEMTAPPPGTKVAFTRPIYPFPAYARYDGHGDVNDARSFRPVEPK